MGVTTHRPEKLGDVIRDILARLVQQEVRDPRVGFVTLTDVELSPDLRHAKVFISRLGDAHERAASVAALNRASGFLRRALAREANFRRTPDLVFFEDTAVESGSRVEDLLEGIRRSRPALEDGSAAAPENGNEDGDP